MAATLAIPLAVAAPSTELPSEWYAPLEVETVPGVRGFALVDKSTGQVRIGRATSTNVTFSPTLYSYLPNVVGITTGLEVGGVEFVAVSSTTGNRLSFTPVDGAPPIAFHPQTPGPEALAMVRDIPPFPDPPGPVRLLLNSVYGFPYLELNEDPTIGGGTLKDTLLNPGIFRSLQPLYRDPTGERFAAAVHVAGLGAHHAVLRDDAGLIRFESSASPTAQLHPGMRLASNVYGDDFLGGDRRLLTVGYRPGFPQLTLVTIDTSVSDWVALVPPWPDPFPTDSVPFPVGSVAAVGQSSPGAPQGVLITARDGSQAVHAEITNLGTDLSIVETFTPTHGLELHGLVPVPGRGIILLEGLSSGPATNYRYFSWENILGTWLLRDQGALPSFLAPQTDFATLFWFRNEPFVDPGAELLQFEIHPDWTTGGGSLPAPLRKLTFINSTTGLANPVPVAASAPPSATHVVTSQILTDCSVSVLAPNESLLDPPLTVTPPDGLYTDTVRVVANTLDTTYEILYRMATGGSWQIYREPFGIAYTSTWLFYARDKSSGIGGPITSRTWSFNTSDLTSLDADRDTVPDFVETAKGLNPLSGPDFDGDGRSDLEELLDGTNPNDQLDFESDPPAPALRDFPYIGEGFRVLAQAADTAGDEASDGDPADPSIPTDGELIDLHGMTSNLLASGPVEPLVDPPSLLGQLAAKLDVTTPTPYREWVVLNSPAYFDLDGPAPQTRGGREIYRVLQTPVNPLPVIAPALTGTNQAADTAAWITAAQTAYASYEQVSTITELHPVHTATAVLAESALHGALLGLPHDLQGSLGVPQDGVGHPPPPAVTIPLDPAATFLRTNSDPSAQGAVAINLAANGYAPGDVIILRASGAYGDTPTAPEAFADLLGVFSSSSTILPGSNLHRIPGAIDAGDDFTSPVTVNGGLPTDIPEDFLISSVGGNPRFDDHDPPVNVTEVCLTIPAGATHLFVSPVSTFFGDNTDVLGGDDPLNPVPDFALEIFSRRFTLFGNREGDAERRPLTTGMRDALLAAGLSFDSLLGSLDATVTASLSLRALTDALYDFHVAHSEPTAPPGTAIPLLPLPLDALRSLVHDGALPSDYASVVSGDVLAGAQIEIAGALALLPAAYRPTDTWVVEVGAPTVVGQTYGYTHIATMNPAVLLDHFGELITLDQGLGLLAGSRFSVTGYTDVSGPAGHDAIEPLAVSLASLPVATTADTNANLLSDDWELFFFGALGAVGPFDPHPVSGHSYLQYMLSGHDPRADSMDLSTEPIAKLEPPGTTVVVLQNLNFGLRFPFPDPYFDAFDWGVQESEDLLGFNPLPGAAPVNIGANLYEVDLGPGMSADWAHFFRLSMALKQ